jgi:phosphatidylserine/phosphatidylglycerophosphate/cardiolipin synthase-like enzyme
MMSPFEPSVSKEASRMRGHARSFLVPGRNCWRRAHAARVGFLIDGGEYFGAVRAALVRAERQIFILGWDIDSRMLLTPDGANDGFPQPLREFLNALVATRPQLQIYVLSWDFALLFALEREWLGWLKFGGRTRRRLHFQLDDHHPTSASHHQKLVIVDDALAFVSGFDLTRNRWDTPRHLPTDPLRRNADGGSYPPFHDVGALVDGEAARALAELARERWRRATGRPVRAPEVAPQPIAWPEGAEVALTDIEVGIARTEPAFDGAPAIVEVRQLHLDAIATAARSIFAENQYFTSRFIADAFESRLVDASGPEIIVISPITQSGWLEVSTMGVLRARVHRRLVQADTRRRYRMYCPWLGGDATPSAGCLNVHSKVLIIDDEILSVGSANLTARSMSLDTECNLVIDAAGEPRVRAAIATHRSSRLRPSAPARSSARSKRCAAKAARSGRSVSRMRTNGAPCSPISR